jgi:nicotinate-nucleotide adenylyltransferase
MENRINNIVNILDSKKAENIQTFDMHDQDYFVEQVVIATTLGERHGSALLVDLKKGLKDETFIHIEDENEWIVIDLGDILIHLMTPEYRSRYNIEEFLSDRNEEMKKIRQIAIEGE